MKTILRNLNYGELYFCSSRVLSAAETRRVSAAFERYLDFCDEPEASLLQGFKLTFTVDSEADGSFFAVRRINIGSIGRYGALAAWVWRNDCERALMALRVLLSEMLNISSMECEALTWVNLPERAPVQFSMRKPRKTLKRFMLFDADFCEPCDLPCESREIGTAATEMCYMPPEEGPDELDEIDKKILIDKITALVLQYVTKFGKMPPSDEIEEIVRGKLVLFPDKVSRVVVNRDMKIILQDYNEMEIRLRPLPKAIYILFLHHPEGIVLKDIAEYRSELENIYTDIVPNRDEKLFCASIDDLVDYTDGSLREKISVIKKCINTVILNPAIAEKYYISGEKGGRYLIAAAGDGC